VLIKFFDDPYSDAAGSIKPDAMRRSLNTLSDISSERVTGAPCNAQGEPVRRIA
jgi:hypothetical protein